MYFTFMIKLNLYMQVIAVDIPPPGSQSNNLRSSGAASPGTYTLNKIKSVRFSRSGLQPCPFLSVDRVRFLLWIMSVFSCGSCPFLLVDFVHFCLWIMSVLLVDCVHLFLWTMSIFTCGLCPLPPVDCVHAYLRKYNW